MNSVHEIYNNLTYFDLYGGTFIYIIFSTILLLLFIGFSFVMQNIRSIKNNWTNERCKPQNIPFAGFINKPEDSTIFEFTQTNFNYCTQNIVTNVTNIIVSPLSVITNSLTTLYTSISKSIQSIRDMINSIRTNLLNIINEILGKLVNITIPLRQITLSISDALGRTTAVLVSIYYIVVGSYDILGSIFGAFQQFLEILLVPIIASIIIFNSLFLFPLAIAPSIMALILSVFIGINIYINSVISGNNLGCFDKNTLLIMENGSSKFIKDIQVGDILINNNIVTDKFIFCAKNVEMYKLSDNTIVSGNHYIKYNNIWIQVKNHPKRKKIYNYNEPIIYCINTTSKRIVIENNEFLDWDDKIENNKEIIPARGFNENTPIYLFNGMLSIIKNIKIGDLLSNGEKVIGLVETLDKSNKLYHLLTDTNYFYINNTQISHYD